MTKNFTLLTYLLIGALLDYQVISADDLDTAAAKLGAQIAELRVLQNIHQQQQQHVTLQNQANAQRTLIAQNVEGTANFLATQIQAQRNNAINVQSRASAAMEQRLFAFSVCDNNINNCRWTIGFC